jgi:stearoyl-CoA desaturase (delta-9 desaturase)
VEAFAAPPPLDPAQRLVTLLVVVGPVVALSAGLPLLWGHALHARDLILAFIFYVVTGHGVTVGFHRMFTHRSFRANRALKIALGVAGSLAVQGSVTSWVAVHRRHHVYSDQPGDPHSPHLAGAGTVGRVRGFVHAHVGWLFKANDDAAERYARDLLDDRDVAVMTRLFPVLALASLALPFAIGWLWSGRTIGGALTALLWAGLVRMALLHHVTWSVNSVCHMFGRRPSATKDQSRNFAALAIVSFGESWHNFHHAHPASARHGAGKRQIDSSAWVIRQFERVGWATKVRWPARDGKSLRS